MKFSERLKQAKELSNYYHEGMINSIETILEESPKIDCVPLYSSDKETCHIEVSGSLFDERGTWVYDLKFDDSEEIDVLQVKFVEDRSSNKPFSDTYSVQLRAIPANLEMAENPFPVCEFKLSRVNNYRFSAPYRALSTEEVAKLSKPEIITRKSVAIRHNQIVMVENSDRVGSVLDTKVNQYPFHRSAQEQVSTYSYAAAEITA